MKPAEKELTVACKHLGLVNDPRSLASYPSVANHCYACKPTNTPSLAHQREYCLSEGHIHCPIFRAEQAAPMPREIVDPTLAAEQKAGLSYEATAGILVVIVLLVAGALFAILWPGLKNDQPANEAIAPVAATGTPEPSASPSLIPATEPPSATPTRTATPAPTATATPQVVQLPLESILGTEYKVVLHRVIPGDSISSLAQNYGTSDRAILDATYRLTMPLFVDRIIVIPYQTKNWKDLPPLEPYQVTEAQTSLDAIAVAFGLDPELLKYHNGCEECLISQGSWIVLPRTR